MKDFGVDLDNLLDRFHCLGPHSGLPQIANTEHHILQEHENISQLGLYGQQPDHITNVLNINKMSSRYPCLCSIILLIVYVFVD